MKDNGYTERHEVPLWAKYVGVAREGGYFLYSLLPRGERYKKGAFYEKDDAPGNKWCYVEGDLEEELRETYGDKPGMYPLKPIGLQEISDNEIWPSASKNCEVPDD